MDSTKYSNIKDSTNERSEFQQFIDKLPKPVVSIIFTVTGLAVVTLMLAMVYIMWKPAKSYAYAKYEKLELAKPEAVDSMLNRIYSDSIRIAKLQDSVQKQYVRICQLDSINIEQSDYIRNLRTNLTNVNLANHDLQSTIEWLNKELTKERSRHQK